MKLHADAAAMPGKAVDRSADRSKPSRWSLAGGGRGRRRQRAKRLPRAGSLVPRTGRARGCEARHEGRAPAQVPRRGARAIVGAAPLSVMTAARDRECLQMALSNRLAMARGRNRPGKPSRALDLQSRLDRYERRPQGGVIDADVTELRADQRRSGRSATGAKPRRREAEIRAGHRVSSPLIRPELLARLTWITLTRALWLVTVEVALADRPARGLLGRFCGEPSRDGSRAPSEGTRRSRRVMRSRRAPTIA